MSWFKGVFGTEKVMIASLYLPAMPGSPGFYAGTPIQRLIDATRRELEALQAGGMDAVLLGNQHDTPLRVGVGPESVAMMTRIIGEATRGTSMPFGVGVFWDDLAAIAVAKATGASFVRGVFSGTYAGEMGLMNLDAGQVLRFRDAIDAAGIRLMFMLRPILCQMVAPRDLKSQIKDLLWGSYPDAFALAGPTPGEAPSFDELRLVKSLAKDLPVVMNNGATLENIADVMAAADGAVVATHLKEDQSAAKPFDRRRVGEFMAMVRQHR
jgi:uncharacterized protein